MQQSSLASETASTKDWEASGWKIRPYNFAVIEIDPPADCTHVKFLKEEDPTFLEELEDRLDVEEAERRLSDPNEVPIPYEHVRKELELE
jgi:hypothetical protein